MTVARTNQAGPDRPSEMGIEALFADLESPVLSYALRLVGERDLAEDIVQEAFMKLHVHWAEVQEPRRWVYRTVHNLALNQRRGAARLVRLEAADRDAAASPSELVDQQPLPDEQIARWEGIGLVRLTLDGLDERSRELVRLKFLEELSYKQISERTGLTTGHVGYLLHHALKTMAQELAKIGGAS